MEKAHEFLAGTHPTSHIMSLSPTAPGAGVTASAPVIQDWSRFIAFQPHLYFRPQDLDELKNFLTAIVQGTFKQSRIRMPGSLHSCSDIYASDAIIDLHALPKVLEFDNENT